MEKKIQNGENEKNMGYNVLWKHTFPKDTSLLYLLRVRGFFLSENRGMNDGEYNSLTYDQRRVLILGWPMKLFLLRMA